MPTRTSERLKAGTKVAVRDRRGKTLRHLEIKRRLAEGAHSATYLARDVENERWIVVKAALQGGEDTELAIEEQILLQVESPHLVQLLGGGADARLHKVLAYERLYPNPLLVLSAPQVRLQFPDDPGGRYCPLPPRMALALISDLFRGLAHLHQEGFVHHDVKLGNLLVAIDAAKGRPLRAHEILKAAARGETRGVLIDFGAARSAAFLRELNAGQVEAAEVPPQLTPLYAPPEALLESEGRRVLLPSLDLYAAALVSYSLFCGRTPYEHLGIAASDVRRLLEVKAEEQRGAELPISFEFLTQAPGMRGLGKELFGFLSCCLSGDPSQRPSAQEASAFCEELQAWYHEALAAAPEKATPLPTEAPRRSRGRRSSKFEVVAPEAHELQSASQSTKRGPARLDPALDETSEVPSGGDPEADPEERVDDGFSTSAESALSASRLREQARSEASPPQTSSPDSDAPESKRTRARPSQRARRPPGTRERKIKAALQAATREDQSPAPQRRRPRPRRAAPPGSARMSRQGQPPGTAPLRRQGPPGSAPLRRQSQHPSERPSSERPPSERPSSERAPSERPPSERPPSERMTRQGKAPPPGRGRRQSQPPPGSERTSRQARPLESQSSEGDKARKRPPLTTDSGPKTPQGGLPAVREPRTPKQGLPPVDPSALALPEAAPPEE